MIWNAKGGRVFVGGCGMDYVSFGSGKRSAGNRKRCVGNRERSIGNGE